MRPIDAQNRLPEVATDQFALDRTLKHLRKLRWIGKESEAEKILTVLDLRRCRKAQSDKQQLRIVCKLRRALSPKPRPTNRMKSPSHPHTIPRHSKRPSRLVARRRGPICPSTRLPSCVPYTPGLANPGGFQRAARDPFALRRTMFQEERKGSTRLACASAQ